MEKYPYHAVFESSISVAVATIVVLVLSFALGYLGFLEFTAQGLGGLAAFYGFILLALLEPLHYAKDRPHISEEQRRDRYLSKKRGSGTQKAEEQIYR